MNYYNVLREDANKSIIVIEHREVYRFVTCCSKYSDCVTITQDDNEDYISVYDIIFHKIIIFLFHENKSNIRNTNLT